jgi:hypothetical protein
MTSGSDDAAEFQSDEAQAAPAYRLPSFEKKSWSNLGPNAAKHGPKPYTITRGIPASGLRLSISTVVINQVAAKGQHLSPIPGACALRHQQSQNAV